MTEQDTETTDGPAIEMALKACEILRADIEKTKFATSAILSNELFAQPDLLLSPGNMPPTQNMNMLKNINLAYNHLEDARMRLGKVMQAARGGVSILDKQ